MKSRRRLAVDLVLGTLAGVAATWVMDKVTTSLYERGSTEARRKENFARGGQPVYETAAEKAAELLGTDVDDDERKHFGAGIHWMIGTSAGTIYGLLRNQFPAMGIGSGIAYGAGFWLLMDEAALTALGIAPAPSAFPWQTHARGLVGHLVLGATIESIFDLVDLA